MMFIKAAPNSHGFVNPRHLEQLWLDQFDWVYREFDYAVFAMTIHPDVSGRPQVLLMHERIIEHINKHDGVRWATFDEIADDFAHAATRAERRLRSRSRPRAASSCRSPRRASASSRVSVQIGWATPPAAATPSGSRMAQRRRLRLVDATAAARTGGQRPPSRRVGARVQARFRVRVPRVS